MSHFIHRRLSADKKARPNRPLVLRFPPEPNGYLHLGHAKALVLASDLAKEFDAALLLRMDDTNPEKEDLSYITAIERDVHWLVDHIDPVTRYASDYFDAFYRIALRLIDKGLAYVDTSAVEDAHTVRGTYYASGNASPERSLPVEHHREAFDAMRTGACKAVLRAKIDLDSPNMNLRDPVLYRVKNEAHPRTGRAWHIYPSYDFAHPLSDAIEGITHSLCTLEFEDHRPLYEWVLEHGWVDEEHPKEDLPVQIEFARLNIEGIALSKRKLLARVQSGVAWDDPSMPTLAGLRARGVTPEVLRALVRAAGVSKENSVLPRDFLEDAVRDVLEPHTPRTMGVWDPVPLHLAMEDGSPMPSRVVETPSGFYTLGPTVWIERADVRETSEENFWRFAPHTWVRLKHGCNVWVTEVRSDAHGIAHVHARVDACSFDMATATAKAKGVVHWVGSDARPYPLARYDDSSVRTTTMLASGVLKSSAHVHCERNGIVYLDAHDTAHVLAPLKVRAKNKARS